MKYLSLIFALTVCLFRPVAAWAQLENPAQFKTELSHVSPTEVELTFTAAIDDGWHVYSSDIEDGGPTKAALSVESLKGLQLKGPLRPFGKVTEQMDEIFQMNVRYFEGKATFKQRFTLTEKDYAASGYLEYGACNDQNCLPPMQVPFAFQGNDGPEQEKAAESEKTLPQDEKKQDSALLRPAVAENDTLLADAWQPVVSELQLSSPSSSHGLWWVLLMGLVGGLIAVVTPCVWPVIPMTVSYFLKRSSNQRRAVRDALLYGLSILIIYVGVGVVVTWLFGSNGLNALSTSAVFNLLCFALLVLFAVSFMGGFELALPSSWGNKADRKADEVGGILGIFLMAFTLAIVSFSCTGPIVGFLLVDLTTSSQWAAPIVGLLGFGLGLALPFSVFALFPSFMRKAPKSGGWMNIVKVTLGFVELAFALKFFSVADMAYGWHLLDREVFLCLWIVLFFLLGMYLLGKLRFPSDSPSSHTTLPGFFLGLASLSFALYMLPGLWGAPLKAISAFCPPMSTQDFNLGRADVVEADCKDYDSAIEKSRATGKPILIDFTGYGCVNCRKMEAAVWTDPHVSRRLREDFILVSLYVDDRTPLERPMSVQDNGRSRQLRTVGDKWSYLQSHKFGANTQPFYVVLNAEGKPLSGVYSYDENADHFLQFLRTATQH